MFNKIVFNEGYLYHYSGKDFDLFDWAKETALAKVEFTYDSWQVRNNKFSKFVDIYYGDLAKNIVKAFILENIPDCELVEYDQVRTDNFRNHDKFDLMIDDKIIEIKSSLEKTLTEPRKLISSRRIIININNVHESISDFVIQVFYMPKDIQHFNDIEHMHTSKGNINYIESCNLEVEYSFDNVDIYIAGWIDKDEQVRAINNARLSSSIFRVSNYQTNAGFRKYADVLISNTHKMDEFIDLLKKLNY